MKVSETFPLRIGAAALTLLGVFPLAVVIKYAPVVRWLPVAAREWAVSASVVLLICLLLSYWLGDRIDALLARARAMLLAAEPREFAAWAALVVLSLTLFVALYCFDGQPLGGDEMSQRFQVQLLLHRRLWAVAEQHYEFFSGIQTVNMGGRWFSQFPIGGPALLALGASFGAAWLVNPVLAAWTAANVYRFAAQTTDEVTARVATILFGLSPFVLLMSGTQMNHVGALAFMMLALSELPVWASSDETRRVRRSAVLIGLGLGMMATLRPYDAVGVGLVIGIFQLVVGRRSAHRLRALVWQVIGGMLPVAFLLYVNWRTTGSPLLFGYDALNGVSHRPGFHVDPTGNQFTPLQGLHHISSYLLALNTALFGGPIPAMLLIVIPMALMVRATRWDYLLLGILGALVVGYASYWAESFFFGPRFLYIGIPAFVLFAARFPSAVAGRFQDPLLRRASFLLLPMAVAIAWLLPNGLFRYQGVWRAVSDARSIRAVMPVNVQHEVADAELSDALVLIHESWHGRLTARLRALGAPALTAESMVQSLDACALQAGLDREDSLSTGADRARVQRVIRRALAAGTPTLVDPRNPQTSVALVEGRLVTETCAQEFHADRFGSTAIDPFLPSNTFMQDGRLGGRVVFARDFGLRKNQALLDRFGDRTWYRYRPRTGPEDHGPVFVPYFSAR